MSEVILDQCDCSCHREAGQGTMHMIPCCSRCPYCSKRIVRGNLRQHLQNTHSEKPIPAQLEDE